MRLITTIGCYCLLLAAFITANPDVGHLKYNRRPYKKHVTTTTTIPNTKSDIHYERDVSPVEINPQVLNFNYHDLNDLLIEPDDLKIRLRREIKQNEDVHIGSTAVRINSEHQDELSQLEDFHTNIRDVRLALIPKMIKILEQRMKQKLSDLYPADDYPSIVTATTSSYPDKHFSLDDMIREMKMTQNKVVGRRAKSTENPRPGDGSSLHPTFSSLQNAQTERTIKLRDEDILDNEDINIYLHLLQNVDDDELKSIHEVNQTADMRTHGNLLFNQTTPKRVTIETPGQHQTPYKIVDKKTDRFQQIDERNRQITIKLAFRRRNNISEPTTTDHSAEITGNHVSTPFDGSNSITELSEPPPAISKPNLQFTPDSRKAQRPTPINVLKYTSSTKTNVSNSKYTPINNEININASDSQQNNQVDDSPSQSIFKTGIAETPSANKSDGKFSGFFINNTNQTNFDVKGKGYVYENKLSPEVLKNYNNNPINTYTEKTLSAYRYLNDARNPNSYFAAIQRGLVPNDKIHFNQRHLQYQDPFKFQNQNRFGQQKQRPQSPNFYTPNRSKRMIERNTEETLSTNRYLNEARNPNSYFAAIQRGSVPNDNIHFNQRHLQYQVPFKFQNQNRFGQQKQRPQSHNFYTPKRSIGIIERNTEKTLLANSYLNDARNPNSYFAAIQRGSVPNDNIHFNQRHLQYQVPFEFQNQNTFGQQKPRPQSNSFYNPNPQIVPTRYSMLGVREDGRQSEFPIPNMNYIRLDTHPGSKFNYHEPPSVALTPSIKLAFGSQQYSGISDPSIDISKTRLAEISGNQPAFVNPESAIKSETSIAEVPLANEPDVKFSGFINNSPDQNNLDVKGKGYVYENKLSPEVLKLLTSNINPINTYTESRPPSVEIVRSLSWYLNDPRERNAYFSAIQRGLILNDNKQFNQRHLQYEVPFEFQNLNTFGQQQQRTQSNNFHNQNPQTARSHEFPIPNINGIPLDAHPGSKYIGVSSYTAPLGSVGKLPCNSETINAGEQRNDCLIN